eukprot:scaffold72236_cov39-Attheya_sp.AAC.1
MFRNFIAQLGYGQADRTRHHEDNQPAIDIIAANKVSSRVRHIHIPMCYMHHHYDRGVFTPVFCRGTLMCADVCTKPVAGPLLKRHYDFMRGLQFKNPSLAESTGVDSTL